MGYDMTIQSDRPVKDEEAYAAAQQAFDTACRARDTAFPRDAGHRPADPAYQALQAQVEAAYEAMNRAQTDYFRLNIWGMGTYREVMERTGMGFYPENEQPAWPEPSAFGFSADDEDARYRQVRDAHEGYPEDGAPEPTETELENLAKLEAANDKVLAWHGDERHGIPLHKFGSNDGWHVTADECKQGLDKFAAFLLPAYPGMSADVALATWRAADDAERKIMASKALVEADQEDVIRRPWQDEPNSVVDTLAEPYFLSWLDYLTLAHQHQGFRVY